MCMLCKVPELGAVAHASDMHNYSSSRLPIVPYASQVQQDTLSNRCAPCIVPPTPNTNHAKSRSKSRLSWVCMQQPWRIRLIGTTRKFAASASYKHIWPAARSNCVSDFARSQIFLGDSLVSHPAEKCSTVKVAKNRAFRYGSTVLAARLRSTHRAKFMSMKRTGEVRVAKHRTTTMMSIT